MTTTEEEAVVNTYNAWAKAFQSVDAEAMKSLFDQDYAGILYQAEEQTEAFYTWQAIDEYWSAAPGIIDRIPEWRELTRKVSLDGDSAYVFSKLQTHLEVKGAKRPLLGELRVSMGMHKSAGEWKIIHYHESRHVDIAFLFE